MGLIARWEFERPKRSPEGRTADTFDNSGTSSSRLIIYRPPGGIGTYAVFYTVPTGKVFLLRSIAITNNTVRVNGNTSEFTVWETGDQLSEEYDPPIKYPSGTTFWAFQNVTSAYVRLVGVEEDESLQASRL